MTGGDGATGATGGDRALAASELDRAHAVYRRLAWHDLASDMHTGFRVAYFRTFAVPRIARLLARTGEIEAQPLRRAIDTGLLMYELIDGGHPAGYDLSMLGVPSRSEPQGGRQD